MNFQPPALKRFRDGPKMGMETAPSSGIEQGKAMAAGGVKFEGKGPFYLRTVEHAKACALADTIQLTLYALVEGQGQTLVQIETQMTSRAAEELAITLSRAIGETGRKIY